MFGLGAVIVGLVLLSLVLRTIQKWVGPIIAQVQAEGPRERLAEAQTQTGQPFELRYVLDREVPHHLFLEFHIRAETRRDWSSREVRSNAGFAVRFDAHVGGEHLCSHVVGRGEELPCEVDAIEPLLYDQKRNVRGSDYRLQATMKVASIAPRPAGTEVVIEGTVLVNPHTEASELKLFLSR